MILALVVAALVALLVVVFATLVGKFLGSELTILPGGLPRWALVWIAPFAVLALAVAALGYATGNRRMAESAVSAALYLVAGFGGAWAGTSIARAAAKVLKL